jgi:amino acid adenylation domain-containing protein
MIRNVMLHDFVIDSAERHPSLPALCVDGATLSYAELAACASRVKARLIDECSRIPGQTIRSCLLFAHRSASAYSGVLGILAAGMAYVPLNPTFPPERTASMIKRAGTPIILVDERCREHMDAVLPLIDFPVRIISFDDVFSSHDAPKGATLRSNGSAGDAAYILFTSGTTGIPKGVSVSHGSACAYIANQLRFTPPMADARYSQVSDLTFDPSVHDMFVCWANGGCLHVPASLDALYLAEFVKQQRITHWFSVPSIGIFMQRFRKLRANAFPSLRTSIFGGEALPTDLVRAWMQAAPATQVANVYGPTEATVACFRFDVTPEFLAETSLAVTPIGWPLGGQEAVVVDEELKPVRSGNSGELLLGGSQLASGYLSDREDDHRKFLLHHYPGQNGTRWYRSGDVACVSDRYGMLFRGRVDTQIKLFGHRLELQEIEDIVRKCSDAVLVCVLAWPCDPAGAPKGLVAFLLNPKVDESELLARYRQRLPAYALPHRSVHLENFPLNVNGKVDRKKLAELLT